MPYDIKGDVNVGRRVLAGLAINAPAWVTGRDYLPNDIFVDNNVLYMVETAHTSTTSPQADAVNLVTLQNDVLEILNSAPAGPLVPGSYILDSSGAPFSIELENTKGSWKFKNPNNSLSTNAVTITSTGDNFTDPTGAQVAGDFILNEDGVIVDIDNPDGGADFYVSLDRTLAASSPFISGGSWDASTNTPDLSLAANQVDTNGNLFIYNISASGTQDIGAGSTLYEAGGEIKWFAAGNFRYDPPTVAQIQLSQVQVEDDTDTTFGLLSGERVNQAITANAPRAHFDNRTGQNYPGSFVTPNVPVVPVDGDVTRVLFDDGIQTSVRSASLWLNTFESFSPDLLRGVPVADNAALTALDAKDYERRKVLADGKEYVFELGAASGTLADNAATGFWIEQTPQQLFSSVGTANNGILYNTNIDGWIFMANNTNQQFEIRNTSNKTIMLTSSYFRVGINSSATTSARTILAGVPQTVWIDNSLNLSNAGDYEVAEFIDLDTNDKYRCVMIVGPGYNNNQFSFKKLS